MAPLVYGVSLSPLGNNHTLLGKKNSLGHHQRNSMCACIYVYSKSQKSCSLRLSIFLFSVPLTFCALSAHTGFGNAAKTTNFFVFEVGGMGPVPFDSSSRIDPHPSSAAVHLGLQAIPLTWQLVQSACKPHFRSLHTGLYR